MEEHIDLIIVRGSSKLVRRIQQKSLNIPVLGCADGVCHVYVDNEADFKKAVKIGNFRALIYIASTALVSKNIT